MESSNLFGRNGSGSGGGRGAKQQPKKELQLQGPRPSPLRVSQGSHNIRKPPRHPQQQVAAATSAALPPELAERSQPTIIFDISPKVIHAKESEFMAIVQRLTGNSSSGGGGGGGDVSPAARLAAIERTSPTAEKEKGVFGVAPSSWVDDQLMGLLEGFEMELGQIPGILSPGPAALPAISSGYFSPVTEPQNLSVLQELSPFWHGNNSFSPSSALLAAPMISPSPTPSVDLYSLFSDF